MQMRRNLVFYGALTVLSVCLWAHVSELCDRWDNTFQTGNDVESSAMIAALAAGAAFDVLVAAAVYRSLFAEAELRVRTASPRLEVFLSTEFFGHSPPLSLRV